MNLAKAIGAGFSKIFNNGNSNSGLIRLFEIEYSQEHRSLVRNGVQIDAQFVRNYLQTR